MDIDYEKNDEDSLKHEERKKRRYRIALNVYDDKGGLLGVTADISLDGFFLSTERELGWDEVCMTFSIELPENMGMLITEGVAVVGKGSGYGVNFFLSDENKKKLDEVFEVLDKKEK